ncbi:MAG TPA: hypothetical protein VGK73_03925 [Polyangiaceae bacterium]
MDDLGILRELLSSVYLTQRQKAALGRVLGAVARAPRPGRCQARESGGVQCELPAGHASEHMCPGALGRFRAAPRPVNAQGYYGCPADPLDDCRPSMDDAGICASCGQAMPRSLDVENEEHERVELLGRCGAE